MRRALNEESRPVRRLSSFPEWSPLDLRGEPFQNHRNVPQQYVPFCTAQLVRAIEQLIRPTRPSNSWRVSRGLTRM